VYKIIQEKTKRDTDYPDRYYNLMLHKKILDGTLYDCFDYGYHEEYIGLNDSEYVPIANRAPCLNQGLNLLRSVVEQSVSFLFGEDRFPSFMIDDDDTKKFVDDAVRDLKLVLVFQDAATRGAAGSVAIHAWISKNDRLFVKVHDTIFLTPFFDMDEPDTLIRIVEKKKVMGSDLRNLANPPYQIADDELNTIFWFMREWDDKDETWYLPWKVDSKPDFVPQKDDTRSVSHNLGFVPWIWIKNLAGLDNEIDGKCTFEPGIEGAVQIDYALSLADKALKYNCDPLIVWKTRRPNELIDFTRGAGNFFTVGAQDDVSILETTGKAAAATLEVVNEMKDEVLASIHGCRADPSKLAISNSSVAQRMLYLPMVGLASHLRISYGLNGIVPLIKMLMQMANKKSVKILGKRFGKIDSTADVNLVWQDFFPPTPFDVQLQAQSLQIAVTGGFMSKQTAAENMRKYIDVDDIDAEMQRIENDQKDEQQSAIDLQTAVAKAKPQPTRPITKTKTVSHS
jgi:hypothetical protein